MNKQFNSDEIQNLRFIIKQNEYKKKLALKLVPLIDKALLFVLSVPLILILFTFIKGV